MTNKEQRARGRLVALADELLERAQEGDKLALPYDEELSAYRGDWIGHAPIKLLAAALPDEQPAQGKVGEKLLFLLKRWAPMRDDNRETLTDAILRLLAPSAGPAVDALVADMRNECAKMVELHARGWSDEDVVSAFQRLAKEVRALPTTAPTAGEG